MAETTFNYGPSVVVARDGKTAVEITYYEGKQRISDRDAVGYYFTLRVAPRGEDSRICVMFSGIALMSVSPTAFGLPDFGNKELHFVYFAEARIGEYLDAEGVPELTPSGVAAMQIPCFSNDFKVWEVREQADDDQIEDYVKARLYWAWRFGHEKVVFTAPDLLRLRVSHPSLMRIINLGEDINWQIDQNKSTYVTLQPTQQFLRAERERHRGIQSAHAKPAEITAPSYVDEGRLQQLRAVHSESFDLQRLIALCEELNVCAANNCVFAIAMLTRSIIDHVPPIFGAKTFNEVANSYPGARSFRESMQHLSNSARKIADSHLHVQIRNREVLPTRTQVDFSRDLDVLLSEIVRLLS